MVGLVERAHPQLPGVAAPWPAAPGPPGAATRAGFGWTAGAGYEEVLLDPRGC